MNVDRVERDSYGNTDRPEQAVHEAWKQRAQEAELNLKMLRLENDKRIAELKRLLVRAHKWVGVPVRWEDETQEVRDIQFDITAALAGKEQP